MNAALILKFLKDIAKNNNRDWFEKNKEVYLEAKSEFEDFLEDLHKELVKIDPGLAGLNPRKQGFRIYRDVRFSKDKRPYKEHAACDFRHYTAKDGHAPGVHMHFAPE